eukprot:NODE_6436_length_886_cov_11.791612_g5843_i0.p1 GENE.NODE_6436_length_886_cov_11.791612_g5843_i0~~NODE_6436_length_886_cov_11.791612_g5843_i0.p1  ORF type:complete len:247 (-),score=46.89 NODE_6436_length_886_cov_11.791612_g5843_i0:71-811(-)
MSKTEYISIDGLRVDGRRANEIRTIKTQLGVIERADGSCLLEQGNTKVLAVVHGPREVRINRNRGKSNVGCAIVVEYSIANFNFSGEQRHKKKERKYHEVCQAVRKTFESIICSSLYPESQIEIHLQVQQNDGPTLAVCINAASLALAHAGVPMKDFVTACTVGYIDNHPLLDINQIEQTAGGPELPVAMLCRSLKVCLVQMDAKVAMEIFDELLDAAIKGCSIVYKKLEGDLREYAKRMLETRGV